MQYILRYVPDTHISGVCVFGVDPSRIWNQQISYFVVHEDFEAFYTFVGNVTKFSVLTEDEILLIQQSTSVTTM